MGLRTPFQITAATLFVLSASFCYTACSGSKLRPCRWLFVSAGGKQMEGESHLAEIEQGHRPWLSAVSNRTGRLTVFFCAGKPIREEPLINGLRSGCVRAWYRNGQLMQEQEFVAGKQHGKMTLWNSEGQKESVASYSNDLLHGVFVSWYSNGQIRSSVQFSEGKLHGTKKGWDVGGNLIEDGVYQQMQPWNGKLIILKKQGSPPLVGVYTNGLLLDQYSYKGSD